MGTRADFYVGKGEQAEWLGSVGWDGYPNEEKLAIFDCTDESTYRQKVDEFLTLRSDATRPEAGWPWPWPNSRTTDYAYTFDVDKVVASCFGHEWFDPKQEEPEHSGAKLVFPDMTQRQNIRMDNGSGLIFMSAPKDKT